MNPKLESIAATAAENLKQTIAEAEIELMNAWQDVAAKAQDDEKAPVLSLSFSVKLNLDADTMTTTLSFGVRRKYEIASQIPDPNQSELPIGAEN